MEITAEDLRTQVFKSSLKTDEIKSIIENFINAKIHCIVYFTEMNSENEQLAWMIISYLISYIDKFNIKYQNLNDRDFQTIASLAEFTLQTSLDFYKHSKAYIMISGKLAEDVLNETT